MYRVYFVHIQPYYCPFCCPLFSLFPFHVSSVSFLFYFPQMTENITVVLLESCLFQGNLKFYQFSCKWHSFILRCAKIRLHCLYIPHFLSLLIPLMGTLADSIILLLWILTATINFFSNYLIKSWLKFF